MMAKQGVQTGSGSPGGGMSMKICMTREMVERNEIPAQQGDCKTTAAVAQRQHHEDGVHLHQAALQRRGRGDLRQP